MLDLVSLSKGVALGVLQGLTEFLPVSSTGHMIVFGKLLQFDGEIAKIFEVFVQLGTTLALILYFRKDLLRRISQFKTNFKFFSYLLLAFLPVAVVGLLFHKNIEFLLDSIVAVGVAQILGACLILYAEWNNSKNSRKTQSLDTVSARQAVAVGLWQIISLWPGMSRSGSTIMGGMLSGLNRTTATQFSFYLSIPISLASSFFILFKHHDSVNSLQNIQLLFVGFIAAFIVGFAVIHFIMNYIRKHSFVIFAYYRFILGAVILFVAWNSSLTL